MRKLQQAKLIPAFIIVLLVLLLLPTTGCKKVTEIVAQMVVNNECGVSIDVFMDGLFQFSVDNTLFKTIENISIGAHVFVANRRGTSNEVTSLNHDVLGGGDLLWVVQSQASIKVTNTYGEPLDIFADNVFEGQLADQESESITHVPYGVHQIEATLPSDSSVVDSIFIDIIENIEYTWTVTK